MPWHVAKSDECPASKPWACIRDSNGAIEGCHATKADAEAQRRALYAQEDAAVHPINAAVAGAKQRTAHLEAKLEAAYRTPLRALARLAERNLRRHTHTGTDGRPLALPDPDELMPTPEVDALFEGVADRLRLRIVTDSVNHLSRVMRLDIDRGAVISRVMEGLAPQTQNLAASSKRQIADQVSRDYEAGLTTREIGDRLLALQALTAAIDAKAYGAMVARTEMASAQSSANIAVARDSQAVGYKTWATAPGAIYPRHENYEELDGQTVGLDDLFDVGGYPADHPADPDLPSEEAINCRCDVLYGNDSAGGDTGHPDAFQGGASLPGGEPAVARDELTSLRDSMSVKEEDMAERSQIRTGVDAIDKVHPVPSELGTATRWEARPMTNSRGQSILGHYMPSENLIELGPGSTPETMIHEFGHALSDTYLTHSEWADLSKSMQYTSWWQKVSTLSNSSYLRDAHECFARAYSQWIRMQLGGLESDEAWVKISLRKDMREGWAWKKRDWETYVEPIMNEIMENHGWWLPPWKR